MDYMDYSLAFAIMALYYGVTHWRQVVAHIMAAKSSVQRLTDIRFSRKRLAIVELSERERRTQLINMMHASSVHN